MPSKISFSAVQSSWAAAGYGISYVLNGQYCIQAPSGEKCSVLFTKNEMKRIYKFGSPTAENILSAFPGSGAYYIPDVSSNYLEPIEGLNIEDLLNTEPYILKDQLWYREQVAIQDLCGYIDHLLAVKG